MGKISGAFPPRKPNSDQPSPRKRRRQTIDPTVYFGNWSHTSCRLPGGGSLIIERGIQPAWRDVDPDDEEAN